MSQPKYLPLLKSSPVYSPSSAELSKQLDEIANQANYWNIDANSIDPDTSIHTVETRPRHDSSNSELCPLLPIHHPINRPVSSPISLLPASPIPDSWFSFIRYIDRHFFSRFSPYQRIAIWSALLVTVVVILYLTGNINKLWELLKSVLCGIQINSDALLICPTEQI